VRLKPFFRKPEPKDEANEIYVHDKKITMGKLTVEVREASHLPKALKAVNTYCTVEIFVFGSFCEEKPFMESSSVAMVQTLRD
jgi:hypothetical protein